MPSAIAMMGPGGQARVTLDAALAAGLPVKGLLDDSGAVEYFGIPVLGPLEAWRDHLDADFIAGMSDSRRRVGLGDAIVRSGGTVLSVVHPSAWVSPYARLGRGVLVMHSASVHPDATIGDHAVLNAHAAVDHDCEIGRGASLGPGVTFPGTVRVGAFALVGAGVVARPGVSIGEGAVIGAGAVVTRDVPAGETWAGNPARVLGRPDPVEEPA